MKRYKQILLYVVSIMSSIYNCCDRWQLACEVNNKEINSQCAELLVRPTYIQNPVNGRFWPNLDFRKASSWTATNLKLCTKHGWWSIRPPSKFQVKIIFIR